MIKLVLRIFIICILVTLVVAPLIIYIQQRLDAASSLGNIKLITQGEFTLLDELLAPYPPQAWPELIKKLHPYPSEAINFIAFDKLTLPKNKIMRLKNNKITYEENPLNPYLPLAAYKKVANTAYVYQQKINFNAIENAQQMFGLSNTIINNKLRATPKSQWPTLLRELSLQYGYPITVQAINQLPLTNSQKQRLLNQQWVADYPDRTNDNIQFLYTPIDNNLALGFGPIKLPFVATYQIYIVLVSIIIIIELILFLFILLFARSLEKLKTLANAYGQGNFDSIVQFGKTSTLFPLFSNLVAMGARIKSLLASHKELTNSVSHELRTPLSRLRFSLELLKEAKTNEQIITRINAMENDVTELDELVTEILTYAQLDQIAPQTKLDHLTINELIQQATAKLQPSLLKNTLSVCIPADLDTAIIAVNAKYALRALQNILQNANRYAVSQLKISVIKLNESKNHKDELYQIIIEDDGPGIPEEDRERVFNPFTQLSNQQGSAHQGYGLGLAITKKISIWHGWKIDIADSDLGGTKMIITLASRYNS